MARHVPDTCPAAPERALEAAGKWASRCYDIHVVTLLFGGGVTPAVNDPVTLIRGPSIRGQLRFWWRATRGTAFENVDSLRKREGEIWGTAESASPVTLWVSNVHKGAAERWAEYEPDHKRGGVKSIPKPVDHSYPGYALFPFQGTTEKNHGPRAVQEQPAVASQDASFTLHLRWPAGMDIAKDVDAALWAWVNFGGLGARTRRGCGTLFCREFAPAAADAEGIRQWYAAHFKEYDIDATGESKPWPTLAGQPLILCHGRNANVMSPKQAWLQAIKLLQEFRQGQGMGRECEAGNRPGRSYWPEADSLRRLTGQSLPAHRRSTTTMEDAFPRAEFGLPIIFHFKDSDMNNPDREPADCSLLPAGGTERMASPLILKALALGSNQAVPMILPLRTPRLDKVVVKIKGGKVEKECCSSDAIRRPDLAAYAHSPLKGRSQSGSALEAFINYAREEGFR